MKREEFTISVHQTLGGKWIGQVRQSEFGLSYPHAKSRRDAWEWVLATARKEIERDDDHGSAA